MFADPITGEPLDKAANLRRYRKVLKAAALDAAHNLHGLGTRSARGWPPPACRCARLQEWMGHRDISTTERYADYAPSQHESELIERAWASRDAPLEGGHEAPKVARDQRPRS